MPLQKSTPIQKTFLGQTIEISEVVFVSNSSYSTNGEKLIVTKNLDSIEILLDSSTTEHLIIKALTQTKIKPVWGMIDEEYSEVNIGKGACVELYFSFGNWYIVSSDGIKMEELH